MEINDIIDDIKLINKAVWISKTLINFAADGADGGRIIKDDEKENIIKVPTVRLKDYLSDPVDFLKIDIEGAETEVLLDCNDALMNVENLFVEYHSFSTKPQTVDKILSVLTDNGFRYHIHPELTRPKPFISHKTDADMDMRLNIFAYQK